MIVVLKLRGSDELLTTSTSVVIPAHSAGPVQIFQEPSVDLKIWVETPAGTYGTSTSNRFFRIRALRE